MDATDKPRHLSLVATPEPDPPREVPIQYQYGPRWVAECYGVDYDAYLASRKRHPSSKRRSK